MQFQAQTMVRGHRRMDRRVPSCAGSAMWKPNRGGDFLSCMNVSTQALVVLSLHGSFLHHLDHRSLMIPRPILLRSYSARERSSGVLVE